MTISFVLDQLLVSVLGNLVQDETIRKYSKLGRAQYNSVYMQNFPLFENLQSICILGYFWPLHDQASFHAFLSSDR